VFFIVSSGSGFLVGREAIMATLREHGISAETVALSSTLHSFWLFDPWLTATVDAMADFLRRMACGAPDE
jgi:acetyl esterase/lipase